MPHAFNAPTLTMLNEHLTERLVLASESELDIVSSVDVQLHNTVSVAESMEWDFNLKDLWLTPSRWTMMCNQYLDPEMLQAWLEQCTGKIGLRGRGQALMRTKEVKPRGGAATGHTNKESRRWGSCMIAISYRATPRPQITLYSRTSYLGYLSGLDLSVAWMCGRYLAQAMGVPVETFQFVWMNESLQFHNFKSMAFLLNHRDERKRKIYRKVILKPEEELKKKYREMIANSPALQLTRRWMANMLELDRRGTHLGEMNYNTYRRIRRRYHTEVHGYEYGQQFEGWSRYKSGPKQGKKKEFFKAYHPLPSVPVQSLTFSRLGLPLDGFQGMEYTEDEGEDDYED